MAETHASEARMPTTVINTTTAVAGSPTQGRELHEGERRAPRRRDSQSEVSARFRGAKDGTGLIKWDPWLEPYAGVLRARYARVLEMVQLANLREGSLLNFARGYKVFGLNRGVHEDGRSGVFFREWAPGALNVSIIGEFNNWDRTANKCTRDPFGHWYCFIADHPDGTPAIHHNTKIKLAMEVRYGQWEDRIPAWIRRVVQPKNSVQYEGVYWSPPEQYQWKHPNPKRPRALRIYETHIGMAGEEGRIHTYAEFERDIVPYVKQAGYNTIQIMAVMEHAYYGSFGYQVTNFFAVSSRFGTPEELKSMVDTCHANGLMVLLDIVHSHASNNVNDGINMFDGTDHHFFHSLPQGRHPIWDSRLFNYSNWETVRFLLSNVVFFLEEYRFDGFRFDGVTSMLYNHHGVGDITFDYAHYFGGSVDHDALAFLTLANDVIHQVNPEAVTIAEDVSGFPGLCRPVWEGGVGFDYRLQMACPDLWVALLKRLRDEDWSMGSLAYSLSNRRWMEPCISYAESHDQALVGDKTIAFWLMDSAMYTHMSTLSELTPVIARGIALHKLIRLVTCLLAGEGYLCFMGNEFGHPEWIDFPREGNAQSYHYCRRQWHLVNDPLLRYQHLANFDKAMMALEDKYHFLSSEPAYISLKHEADKVLVFERAGLLVAFNFHPSKSFTDYRIPVSEAGEFKIVLETDAKLFGGFGNVDGVVTSFSQPQVAYNVFKQSLQVYLPSRTAIIWRRVDRL